LPYDRDAHRAVQQYLRHARRQPGSMPTTRSPLPSVFFETIATFFE